MVRRQRERARGSSCAHLLSPWTLGRHDFRVAGRPGEDAKPQEAAQSQAVFFGGPADVAKFLTTEAEVNAVRATEDFSGRHNGTTLRFKN